MRSGRLSPDCLSLVITTPTEVAATADDIRHLRAEDATGAFGILPGHADLLTALGISVVSWRGADGRERHCAVRGTLFLYLAGANLSGLLPGVKAPTAFIETAAALALIVLLASQLFGIRARGLGPYL